MYAQDDRFKRQRFDSYVIHSVGIKEVEKIDLLSVLTFYVDISWKMCC